MDACENNCHWAAWPSLNYDFMKHICNSRRVLLLSTLVAQVRNMSISEHRQCCVTFEVLRICIFCVGKKPIVSLTYEKDFKIKNQLTLHKICVTSLLCGPWADLWPFYMGCTVNGFLSIKSFTKVGDSSEAARPIHRRKTVVNSLQRLQSPPHST